MFCFHFFSPGTLCKSWVNLPLFHFTSLFQFFFFTSLISVFYVFYGVICIFSLLRFFLFSSTFVIILLFFSHVIVEFTFYLFLLTHDLSFWSLKYLFHALSSKRVLLDWAFSISGEKFICYSRPLFCLIVFVRYSYLFPLVCLLLFLVVYFLWPWWSFPFFHCSF